MPQDVGHSMETGGSCHTTLRASPTTSGIITSLTLQLRQRTQADDPGLRISCHRTPGTHWRPGAPATRHSVPHPPRVASYLSLFIRFLNTTDTDKGTAVNHHRRSPGLSRGLLGGGTYAKPSGPCPRDAFTYQSGGDLGCGLVDVYGGECSPTTLVAVTTSYFSSRNFRQSLVLTLL